MNNLLLLWAGIMVWTCLSGCGKAATPLEGDPNKYPYPTNLDDVDMGTTNTGDDINKGTVNSSADINEGDVDMSKSAKDGKQQIRDDIQNNLNISPIGKADSNKETNQMDIDGDGIPNERDDDIDGDGVKNIHDNDIDGDGYHNEKDADIDGDLIPNTKDGDIDGDGIGNIDDNDIDGDGIPNTEDPDIDGDGIPNTKDMDIDGDGILNVEDNDIDGDGIPNTEDNDIDGDGILNTEDDDIDGDGISNKDDKDANGDGIPDAGQQGDGDPEPVNSSEGTQVVVTSDKSVTFGLDNQTFLIQNKELDLAEIRRKADEENMNLADAVISKVHVTADLANQMFENNKDIDFQLIIRYEVQNVQNDILYTRDFSSSDPGPPQFGDLQAGINLNEELFIIPSNWSTFEKIVKGEVLDENGQPLSQTNLYFIFLFSEPLQGDGEMDIDFDLEFTGAKKL